MFRTFEQPHKFVGLIYFTVFQYLPAPRLYPEDLNSPSLHRRWRIGWSPVPNTIGRFRWTFWFVYHLRTTTCMWVQCSQEFHKLFSHSFWSTGYKMHFKSKKTRGWQMALYVAPFRGTARGRRLVDPTSTWVTSGSLFADTTLSTRCQTVQHYQG